MDGSKQTILVYIQQLDMKAYSGDRRGSELFLHMSKCCSEYVLCERVGSLSAATAKLMDPHLNTAEPKKIVTTPIPSPLLLIIVN